MPSTDGLGFHLPDGEAYTDVLRWFLVAVPDKPEYVRAAMFVYTQFTKWYVWERDELKRGADAADAWDDAVDLTLEYLEMGFPGILLDRMDSIIWLLENADYCCALQPYDEVIESDFEESVPGTDTPPATWGDGETVADTDDWAELVCGAAHAYVDHLVAMANQIQHILNLGNVTLGFVAAVLALLSGAGILAAVAYGTAAGAVGGLANLVGTGIFTQAAADFEAARDDIVCAVKQGNLAAAVQDAISSAAWTSFFQFVNYTSARNVMLEGGHGEEYLGVNRRSDCDCAIEYDFLHNAVFDTGSEGWSSTTGWHNDFCNGSLRAGGTPGGQPAYSWIKHQTAAAEVGFNLDNQNVCYLRRIEIDICDVANAGGQTGTVRVDWLTDGVSTQTFTVAEGTFGFDYDAEKRLNQDATQQIRIQGQGNGYFMSAIRVYYVAPGSF